MTNVDFFLPAIAGCFGAVIGSFLNVVIYRLPRESMTISKPTRSFCPSCGHSITWYENVPIISYLVLGGRCRACRQVISWRYPVVEGLCLLLFMALTFHEFDGLVTGGPQQIQLIAVYLCHLVLVMVALVVTFIDLEFQIIPNEINYGGVVIALILSPILPLLHSHESLFSSLQGTMPAWSASLVTALVGAVVGASALLLVGIVGKWIFKKDAMGLGDVKFMAFMGAVFGWGGALTIFLLGCLVGAVVGLGYKLATRNQEIPFGPFLSVGMLVFMFFREEVYHFMFQTWPGWINSALL